MKIFMIDCIYFWESYYMQNDKYNYLKDFLFITFRLFYVWIISENWLGFLIIK